MPKFIYFRVVTAAAALMLLAGRARAIGAFDINIIPGPTLQSHPDALASFELAARAWESHISNPIRINVSAELSDLGSTTIIGSTGYGSENLNLDYTQVRNAMAARAGRPGDAILAALPTTDQVTANVPAQGAFDNTTIGLTRGNQKALGLIPNALTDSVIDAVITFNINFNFDFDRTNGVDPQKYDFQTVATHELGHALGFVSDVDDYDFDPTLLDNATTMDLFRFNKNNIPASAFDFTTKPREMRPGQEAVFYDLMTPYDMSTGSAHGDGNQASHWKDDFYFDQINNTLFIGPTIGIMDPTLNSGSIENIDRSDLRVMELIGYDTVIPESGAGALVVLAVALTLKTSRFKAQ